MNVMNELLSDINRLTSEPTAGTMTYYCCADCSTVYGSNSGPKAKCECGSEGFQYPGSTKEEARERRNQAQPVQTSETHAPAVEVAQPKKRAKKTQEAAPPVVAPAPTASAEPVDFRAEREAKVAAFIQQRAINEFSPTPVGTAKVSTVGFTVWTRNEAGAKPSYRLFQPFETAQDFRAAFDAARAEQPALNIDCCACHHVSDPELEACLFKGDLIASLNNGHGTIQVRRGDVVKLGCYKTKENRLRFAVIE